MDHQPNNPGSSTKGSVDFYDSTYSAFSDALYREVRRQTWDEDFGQNSWLTAAEQNHIIAALALAPGRRFLDVACGSGGPTLRIVHRVGAVAVGVDVHPTAVAEARRAAAERSLEHAAAFHAADAQATLSFEDAAFDAIVCIDAVNHLADRSSVLADWARLLRPGGRLYFTDPVVVTGPVSGEDLAIRSSIGSFIFTAPDTNPRLLTAAGLHLQRTEDVTDALAHSAARWHVARAKVAADLIRIEGEPTFLGQQRFLETAARLASERQLSRLAFTATKPTHR